MLVAERFGDRHYHGSGPRNRAWNWNEGGWPLLPRHRLLCLPGRTSLEDAQDDNPSPHCVQLDHR